MRVALIALIALTIAGIAGCQTESGPIVAASGQVNAGGKPLSGAVIMFEPMSGTTGPNASVPVMGGRFEVLATQGLHGGDYRVRLSMIPASIRQSIPADAGFDMPAADAVISPRFDVESDLSCTLVADHSNQLTFEVDFLKP
jgi:hypothetical protein